MAGDTNIAAKQFGVHYPNKFNLNSDWIGLVNTFGFFGGHHEKNDREWDSNGQALWAIGRFDRMTLETIWSHFIDNGGFRHDSAWNCYGPYLTLQLAHAFLLIGDKERMDICLGWSVDNAAYSRVSRYPASEQWEVVQWAWNEQHCYPISKDFAEFPAGTWYMGDIPHGWAAAEFITLMRDILFFEVDEDGQPHIYIAPGIMPHWVGNNQSIGISDAPTIFGNPFSFRLTHRQSINRVEIDITQHPVVKVDYRFPCPFGSKIDGIELDGHRVEQSIEHNLVLIPSGTRRVVVNYL